MSFAAIEIEAPARFVLHTIFKIDTELKPDFRGNIQSLQGRLSRGVGYICGVLLYCYFKKLLVGQIKMCVTWPMIFTSIGKYDEWQPTC